METTKFYARPAVKLAIVRRNMSVRQYARSRRLAYPTLTNTLNGKVSAGPRVRSVLLADTGLSLDEAFEMVTGRRNLRSDGQQATSDNHYSVNPAPPDNAQSIDPPAD